MGEAVQRTWLVVGAGPAGIAAVGRLLDLGERVTWIDPSFTVGRFACYAGVPSNTRVALFVRFLQACRSFEADRLPGFKKLLSMPADKGCQLSFMIEALREVTSVLLGKVHYLVDNVTDLVKEGNAWHAKTLNGNTAGFSRAVLAIGGHPRPHAQATLSVDEAMNPDWWRNKQGRVAVIGNSHTACLILKTLHALQVPAVCFYRQEVQFAVYHPDGRIQRDNSGLKGEVAEWVKLHWHQLERIRITEVPDLSSFEHVVAAIGFDRNQVPIITVESAQVDWHEDLLGFGMAFPEIVQDSFDGRKEMAIGLWKFMDYLQRTLI